MSTWQTVEPLSDEPQDQGLWEPWQPQIGQRVRVRLSGECQFHHLGNAHISNSYTFIDAVRDGTLGGPGFMGANGAIGTIQSICPSDPDDGHPYLVSDTVDGKWDRVDDFFALSELEPLE